MAFVCLFVGLPLLLPLLKKLLPSYGVMDVEAYDRQCELTTEAELTKLRLHVQRRGVPDHVLSEHARDRTATFAQGLSGFRRMDALAWMQHVISPEKRATADGFEIGDDGRRIDRDDDAISLSDGSLSDPEEFTAS